MELYRRYKELADAMRESGLGTPATRAAIIEGLIAIAQGENPRNIEAKLAGFLH